MDIKVLEKKKDRLVIEVRGEGHTLLNLLREKAWASGVNQASYIIEHPYMSHPKITIRADDPIKALKGAIQKLGDEAKEFDREFSRSLKR